MKRYTEVASSSKLLVKMRIGFSLVPLWQEDQWRTPVEKSMKTMTCIHPRTEAQRWIGCFRGLKDGMGGAGKCRTDRYRLAALHKTSESNRGTGLWEQTKRLPYDKLVPNGEPNHVKLGICAQPCDQSGAKELINIDVRVARMRVQPRLCFVNWARSNA